MMVMRMKLGMMAQLATLLLESTELPVGVLQAKV